MTAEIYIIRTSKGAPVFSYDNAARAQESLARMNRGRAQPLALFRQVIREERVG